MTNEEMARGSVRMASEILREAEAYHRDRIWNLVVRRSQEVVELSLKGMLRFSGVEIPKVHDVGGLIRRYEKRLPSQVVEQIDRIVGISKRLREEREISFYGDEEIGASPEELYSQEDAEKSLSEAGFVLEICRSAIERSGG